MAAGYRPRHSLYRQFYDRKSSNKPRNPHTKHSLTLVHLTLIFLLVASLLPSNSNLSHAELKRYFRYSALGNSCGSSRASHNRHNAVERLHLLHR